MSRLLKQRRGSLTTEYFLEHLLELSIWIFLRILTIGIRCSLQPLRVPLWAGCACACGVAVVALPVKA
jgi:hypothetical protein